MYSDDGSIISTAEGAEEGAEAEVGEEDPEDEEGVDPISMWHPKNPYQVRIDLPDILTV